MAIIHKTTVTPTKVELLEAWLPAQRWYTGKGAKPVLEVVGGFRLEDPSGEVGMQTLLVADHSARGKPVVYQVPLTYRGAPLEGAEQALVGTTVHGVLGTRWVYDGAHDPVHVGALVQLVLEQGQSDDDPPGIASTHHAYGRSTGRVHGRVVSSRVLRGEQSNTSVICDVETTEGASIPLIIKVFRTLQAGDNPDVVLQGALTDAGSTTVPTVYGWVDGSWDDPSAHAGSDRPRLRGHLAFAQAFIPGVEDAWRVALVAATTNHDFSDRARELGVMTAEIHRALASALGTSTADDAAHGRLAQSMQSRLHDAVEAHPPLAAHADTIAGLLAHATTVTWPPLQRIHGDYHLGQVLDTPHEGWKALDFEGEPLRPLAERTLPDLTARDVAGMLRSFDYAAGSVTQAANEAAAQGGSDQATAAATAARARAWAASARRAFLDGYASVAGDPTDADRELVRALELDKALYEVVYEARNRPGWLPIPTSAIDRLLHEGSHK